VKRQVLILFLAGIWTAPLCANAAAVSKPVTETRCSRCHGDPPNRVCLPMICPDAPAGTGAEYHAPGRAPISVADMRPCMIDGKLGRCYYEPK